MVGNTNGRLDQIEKAVVWVVGLLAAVAGAATAATDVLPKSVSVVLVAMLPVLVAVERYMTNKTG